MRHPDFVLLASCLVIVDMSVGCTDNILPVSVGDTIPPPGGSPQTNPALPPPPPLSCLSVPTGGPPNSEPLVEPNVPPPPISGGTLLIASDGETAIAADPDRDVVWIADIVKGRVLGSIGLHPGDEPGRLVEDGNGRVHVVLRGGGGVASIDLANQITVNRTATCPEPRGIAYDPSTDLIHVACTGGELVSLPAVGGPAVRILQVQPDLRDVIVLPASTSGGPSQLAVSVFRAAQLVMLDANGNPSEVAAPPISSLPFAPGFEADVAYRSAAAVGGVAMVHQVASINVDLCPSIAVNGSDAGGSSGSVPYGAGGTNSGSSGGPTDAGIFVGDGGVVLPPGLPPAPPPALGAVTAAVTLFSSNSGEATVLVPGAVVPVDIATADDGSQFAIVSAGNDQIFTGPLPCAGPDCQGQFVNSVSTGPEPIAVAFTRGNQIVVQTREPAIYVLSAAAPASPIVAAIALPGASRQNTGHRLFHRDTGQGIACASCHPEAREDGRVWQFAPIGPRRTMSLGGGILSRAPYHWNGDEASLSVLMTDVFVGRMGGLQPSDAQIAILGRWLNAQSAPRAPAPADPAAVARGQTLFNDPTIGCVRCHAGIHFTNDQIFDVGTGGPFKVPSLLGLWARPPYLHSGCAATLADRFNTCATPTHGNTLGLTPAQVSDLVNYLGTL
jgi:hypothetical protein